MTKIRTSKRSLQFFSAPRSALKNTGTCGGVGRTTSKTLGWFGGRRKPKPIYRIETLNGLSVGCRAVMSC